MGARISHERTRGDSQDINAGDGTTSVTVLCGALLNKCLMLLDKGVHPTIISDAMNVAAVKACEVRPHLLAAAPCPVLLRIFSYHPRYLPPPTRVRHTQTAESDGRWLQRSRGTRSNKAAALEIQPESVGAGTAPTSGFETAVR